MSVSSDIYFESRPDGSKLSAIVSDQSEVISSRAFGREVESLLSSFEGYYSRPDHWGGF
jgi:pyridoxamine 5'-phosphate oxidase